MPMEAIARLHAETLAKFEALQNLQIELLRGLIEADLLKRNDVMTMLVRAHQGLTAGTDPAGRDLLIAIEDDLPMP